MKLWYCRYQLFPKDSLNRAQLTPRHGFLIKVQTSDFEAGYADVHPWEMFGDATVDEQLRLLRTGQPTPLAQRSLFFATLDGLARSRKKSLFRERIKIRSHYNLGTPSHLNEVLLQKVKDLKFKTLKVKLGRDPEVEAAKIERLPMKLVKAFRWRLDFNGFGAQDFFKYISPHFLEVVELMEDPEPYNLKAWRALSRKVRIPVAFDCPPEAPEKPNFRGPRVIKPARQKNLARLQDIITNSMDHPVGQSFAYWQAQESVKRMGRQPRDYGLHTHHLFESNDFFREITTESPYFRPSVGWGVGFNDLLSQQPWREL